MVGVANYTTVPPEINFPVANACNKLLHVFVIKTTANVYVSTCCMGSLQANDLLYRGTHASAPGVIAAAVLLPVSPQNIVRPLQDHIAG